MNDTAEENDQAYIDIDEKEKKKEKDEISQSMDIFRQITGELTNQFDLNSEIELDLAQPFPLNDDFEATEVQLSAKLKRYIDQKSSKMYKEFDLQFEDIQEEVSDFSKKLTRYKTQMASSS